MCRMGSVTLFGGPMVVHRLERCVSIPRDCLDNLVFFSNINYTTSSTNNQPIVDLNHKRRLEEEFQNIQRQLEVREGLLHEIGTEEARFKEEDRSLRNLRVF